MRYFRKIDGPRLYLSPMNSDDAAAYCVWMNDPEVMKYLMPVQRAFSIEMEREALQRLQKEMNFSIIAKGSPSPDGEPDANDILIGSCGLMDYSSFNRSAEAGIFIGRKDYWGKGYGTEAFGLLIDYAINLVGINNLQLHVYSYNERAIACYKKLGFREVGRLREARFYGGSFHDNVIMDLLPGDFRLPSVLPPV